MVDEDGKFTELAGPELQNLAVMTEGTDKGSVCTHQSTPPRRSRLTSSSGPSSHLHAEGLWGSGEGGAVCPQLSV